MSYAQYVLKYPKWTPTETNDLSHINLSILGKDRTLQINHLVQSHHLLNVACIEKLVSRAPLSFLNVAIQRKHYFNSRAR